MATIKEIAKLANVSATTVSRVLNKDETLVVSTQVKEQIFKIAKELQYIPPKMRHAQKESFLNIGVADWHIVRKDRPNIQLASLESVANQMTSQVEVSFVRMAFPEEVQVDGIIAFGSFSDEEMEFLKRQSKAIVFVNSDQSDYEFDRIVMDFDQGMLKLVNYLMDEKEYRSIGYIGGLYSDQGSQIGSHRLKALKDILCNRNCFQEEYFKVGELSKESGYGMAKELLATKDVPEVLVLGSDEVAEGALEAIKEEKYRIPKDVAVVIYKDIATLESKYPTYTRLTMLPDIVWSTALKLLFDRILQKREETMKIFLPTKLEFGDSA
ncbi:MAG: LacI family DNA-binding transcriptional regulator [Clostridiales bacterium]|nr:LacI family DNA-binding transcriptional regulator [Clostridiales bacterium]